MRTRAVLPYFAALVLLAWILGSLARSGTGGDSILAGSYWLLYLVYLIPLFALGGMVVMIIFLLFSWRVVSDALGFGLAVGARKKRRQNSTLQVFVWVTFWSLAVGILFWRCGGLFCRTNSTETNQTLVSTVTQVVGNNTGFSLPDLFQGFAAPVNAFGGLVGSPAFAIGFLGLLIISTVILARGIIVSFNETRSGRFLPAEIQQAGQVAVREALNVLEMDIDTDPRTRIMACYESMIRAAARLGANVSFDQTARELEAGIRRTFELRGEGIGELTRLFEEARYSLHTITETDSEKAKQCLFEIDEELNTVTAVEELNSVNTITQD